MIKETFAAVGHSARGLLRGWPGLALLNVLYAALLVSVYWFFATGVATTRQLVISAVTFVLAPLLFFVLQAAAAHFAVGTRGLGGLLKRALRDFWKILLVSLPLVALGVGLFYLLNKLDGYLPKPDEAARAASAAAGPRAVPPEPLRWPEALSSSLWILLLGFILPLVAAHLWLSVARDGLKATLRRFHRVAGRAFLPRPVLVYALGLLVFALMPYFIIYTRTPVKAAWGELVLFGLRLALAFVFTLWGWTITLGALGAFAPPATTDAAPHPEPPAPAPAEPAAEPQMQT
ncbi:MAG TPA: hypothetical protein VG148_05590 [Pyrinomonadaceae bacterium]|nr:hypothetical protein [Pyrinomonadaceae bacterium]